MSVKCVGVMGLGSIGMRHARNAAQLGYDIVGYDPSPEARRAFETEFCHKASERATALAEADAIVIATPNSFHLDDLRDAIVVAKPVLVEKPLGHDADVAARLVNIASERAVTLVASHNLRFRPVVQKAKKVLAGNELGLAIWARFCCASWLPDWRPGTDFRKGYAADPISGGVIFDAIHELDLAWHLLGPAKLRSAVASCGGLLKMQSEEIADIVLGHDGGCQTTIHLDYVTRPRQRHFEIAGSNGILYADLRSGALKLTAPDGRVTFEENHPCDPNDEYLAVMKDFLDAAEGRGQPACPASEAVATLRLACEARRRAGLPHANETEGLRQSAAL